MNRGIRQYSAAPRLVLLFILVWISPAAALDCPPLQEKATTVAGELLHEHGLLWEISHEGLAPSFLFGTMHVSDPRITDLPEPVVAALEMADRFVMEARLDGAEMRDFSRSMFFDDGTLLSDLLPTEYYERAVSILVGHEIAPSTVETLRPWAAFLTMNMPPDTGTPLDLVLMSQAMARDLDIHGLETLHEQAMVFDVLDERQQVQMLMDTICHYDTVQSDIRRMIRLYLDRDLAGLYAYLDRYALHDNDTYEQFLQSLLWDRNERMAARMRTYLEQGGAFVAIGAMHLPGEQGVLSLLEQAGYRVRAVY